MDIHSTDDLSIDQEILENPESPNLKVCFLCGKSFIAKGRNAWRAKVCPRKHYRNCASCGQPFEISDVSGGVDNIKQTCSRQCGNELKHDRTQQVIKSKYGVDNISQAPEFKEKISEGLRKVATEIAEKRKATMKERYGAEYPMQIPEFREKIFATNQERYGFSNPVYNDTIRMKISKRLKDPEVQAKYLETSLKNWGVSRPSKHPEVQAKMISTNLDKYGVEYVTQHPDTQEKAVNNQRKALIEKYGEDHIPKPFTFSGRVSFVSKINQTVGSKLEKAGFDVSYEHQLEDKRFDLCIYSKKLVIEINPTYTHNSVGNHWGVARTSTYHLDKTDLAKKYGFRCIHIWEWDDVSSIIRMLQDSKRIHARNCTISSISDSIATEFLKVNHIQKSVTGQIYCLGLYCEDELVEVMTFGKPRYAKKYNWELLRLASKTGYSVIGGASKLFQYASKELNGSVVSYCDIAKFTGKVYEKLGFHLDHVSEPSKVWSKNKKHITNNLLLQRGYDQLFGTDFGKGTSNEQLMLEHGWLPVYDCGQQVWVTNFS